MSASTKVRVRSLRAPGGSRSGALCSAWCIVHSVSRTSHHTYYTLAMLFLSLKTVVDGAQGSASHFLRWPSPKRHFNFGVLLKNFKFTKSADQVHRDAAANMTDTDSFPFMDTTSLLWLQASTLRALRTCKKCAQKHVAVLVPRIFDPRGWPK